MTTVFCIRVDTTTPSSIWPRTGSRPWNGHFASVHGVVGRGTSIPTSRAAEPTGLADAAGAAGFFCAFFSAISFHRAFFTRSSGRKRISSPSTSKRSEEHTSELQSLAYLVCRLLLEKKKQTNTYTTDDHISQ